MKKTLTALAIGLSLICPISAISESSYASVPSTVSPQAERFIKSLTNPDLNFALLPAHDDIEGWKFAQDAIIEDMVKANQPVIESLGVVIVETEMGGTSVLEVTPPNWTDNGKRIIYTHGGAYTLNNALSTMPAAASMAVELGMKVISVDYTPAPHSKWQETLNDVVAVFQDLIDQGYDMNDLAIYGDSAGGAMAAGTVLKLRDEGLGMPSSVVLWSPWADIDTSIGDTYDTLRDAEPLLSIDFFLDPSAQAYADPEDFKHPYISPVYGDFTKGYPSTLIQCGTKEIFLSNCVRLYQAMDIAGIDVKLDLYEGMPHVFQYLDLSMPESELAIEKSAGFISQRL